MVTGISQSDIVKARKAQEDFDKAKVRVEEAKSRLVAAKKRADEVRKTINELSKAYRVGGTPAGLSGIVASQIGRLKGRVVAQIQSRLLQILTKFSNQCPNQKELERIIKLRNNLLVQLSNVENRITGFRSIASSLNRTTQGLKTGIQVLKSIPTPTAIIPPQSGGLGIPIGTLNRYSDTLIRLNMLLDKFTNESKAVTNVIDSTLPTIQLTRFKVQSLDAAIESCANSAGAQELLNLLTVTQPPSNTGSEGIPSGEYVYKGFTLLIIQDPNSPKVAPRRFAVAKDNKGRVVLQGPSSFSSSTQVLLDEIKFKLDNQYM